MAERQATVKSAVGLHARPAALFVQAAARVPLDVTVAKTGSAPVNAKSILAVLSLDVRGGEEIVLHADGPGAEQHLDSLATVLETEE
jgi:phosphocarrier protein HPr